MSSITELVSIRQQQAYGALCLAAFCKHFGVTHEAIFALISHLFLMLKVEDLSDWEDDGTNLEISCFGDSLPENIKSSFPPEIRNIAEDVIDRISVIGVVDMYGAITGRSLECLTEGIEFIKGSNIDLPPIEPFVYKDEKGWGNPVSDKIFNELKREYDGLIN